MNPPQLQELTSYILEHRRRGFSRADLKPLLTEAGWNQDDQEHGFKQAEAALNEHGATVGIRGISRALAAWIGLVMISTPLVSLAALYMFQKPEVSFNVEIAAATSTSRISLDYGSRPELDGSDYFHLVRSAFIESGAEFIEADLSSMTLRLNHGSTTVLEVPIESKGREGSWWETPAGLYKVLTKEEEHFSNMGQVWMPWSMQFQGNFFIHGNTYYSDGTPTAREFTGGCIRLSTDDAKRVFELASVGTPILVFENSLRADGFQYEDLSPVPSLSNSYIAGDLGNNYVFADKEADTQMPIASITKLMTALIATEYIDLDKSVTITESMIATTTAPRLMPGQKHTVYQLLFPLLMESSNEAAEAIARSYGREAFIKNMNEKARAIGMTSTVFDDPSGLSSQNVSTAEDLFVLAKYIYHNRSFIFHMTAGDIKDSAYGKNGFNNIGNFNYFTEDKRFVGGKNGQTAAARKTNIGVFELPIGTSSRPIAIIVLGGDDALSDSKNILRYIEDLTGSR